MTSASEPRVGQSMKTSGSKTKNDVLWNYWFDGRVGDPDGQLWEVSVKDAVAKVCRCRGRAPTTIFPAGDYGTAVDVLEADAYNKQQRGAA